jgi:hypothetical protein
MRCPYCARPLSMLGTKCRACRRYILSWTHVTVIGALILLGLFILIDALSRFS